MRITTPGGVAALLLAAALAPSTAAAVANSPDEIDPVKTGDRIPDVTVRTVEGEPFALAEAVAAQPTVLIFYRGGW